MKFNNENEIVLNDGTIYKSNILENLVIGSKCDKSLLRTVMMSYLMVGLKDAEYEEIKAFFNNECNDIVKKYVDTYLSEHIRFEYLKDLKLSEFDYDINCLNLFDIGFVRTYKAAIEKINKYFNEEIFYSLLN